MKAMMCAAIAMLAGAVCQSLVIVYLAPAPWLYESIARLLPQSWMTPILTLSIASAPFGVVVTLALSGGLRQAEDDCR